MGGHGLHVGGCADEAEEPREARGSYQYECLELRTANREHREEAGQAATESRRQNQQKEKKEQQMQRQLNETRAEVMGGSDPERVVMTMAPEPWATQIGTTEPRIMGKRGGPSARRLHDFDSSTCAAGEQEAHRFFFEAVGLALRVTHECVLAEKNHECGN